MPPPGPPPSRMPCADARLTLANSAAVLSRNLLFIILLSIATSSDCSGAQSGGSFRLDRSSNLTLFSRRHVVRLSRRPRSHQTVWTRTEQLPRSTTTAPLVQLNGTSKTGMPSRSPARTQTTMALLGRSRRTNRCSIWHREHGQPSSGSSAKRAGTVAACLAQRNFSSDKVALRWSAGFSLTHHELNLSDAIGVSRKPKPDAPSSQRTSRRAGRGSIRRLRLRRTRSGDGMQSGAGTQSGRPDRGTRIDYDPDRGTQSDRLDHGTRSDHRGRGTSR